MIDIKDIKDARERIDKYIYKTPLIKSIGLSNNTGDIYLKLENQQKLNAYKIRGAISRMSRLSESEKKKGVVTISSGNHGAAVAYGASLLGIENTRIYIPETTPDAKIEKALYYGADVKRVGKNYDQAHSIGMSEIEKNGYTPIFCSDKDTIAGQGSIGLEILEDNSNIDMIIVPIGGGGLITSISVAAKSINPDIKIIGVQTKACPAMKASLEDNKLYTKYPSDKSICDALVGGIDKIPFEMADKYIDDIILVEEEDIKSAIKYLLYNEKLVTEAAGAIGVAALINNKDYFKNKNIAIVLSGGNIDSNLLSQIL